MNLRNLGAQLALEPIHAGPRLVQLVLQPEHMLDAGKVQPELRRQALNQTQPLDVCIGVQTRPARRPTGSDEPFRLVHAKRLRMHSDEVGGDRDHVPRPIRHQRCSPSQPKSRATP